jgi:hypothetical protein
MPSLQHEALLQLFRNRPLLAPELLCQALHQPLPEFTEARVESAELTDIQPAEYRADLVVLLLDVAAVLGIVIEVQLSRDNAKQYAWPAYVANLRTRIKCPVCLLVVTTDVQVARWAATASELGGGQRFTPYVLSPGAVPRITDPMQAQEDPELAVFSAMSHGPTAPLDTSVQIAAAAIAACAGLDANRSGLYVDLVLSSITEAARKALQAMNPANYEYQSEFARRYFSLGKTEGKAELLIRQATLKFGPLTAEVEQQLGATASEELDKMAERLLAAVTVEEVFGPN